MIFISVIWIIYLLHAIYGIDTRKLGVLPRDPGTLYGIFTSVLAHSDLDHILSNTLPMLILGMMLFYFYRRIAFPVFIWIWVVSGIWLWIGGRNNEHYPVYHLGASTLIYGLATFLFFSGVFRKNLQLMVVSALVVFLYGSIMWGIFPLKQEISWEGHLFGAIAGLLVAFNYRKEGPQRKRYDWENDSDVEEYENDEVSDNVNEDLTDLPSEDQFQIRYHYREDNDKTKN